MQPRRVILVREECLLIPDALLKGCQAKKETQIVSIIFLLTFFFSKIQVQKFVEPIAHMGVVYSFLTSNLNTIPGTWFMLTIAGKRMIKGIIISPSWVLNYPLPTILFSHPWQMHMLTSHLNDIIAGFVI